MRIAIVGFGTMGHVVYDSAVRSGHEVVAVIDPHVHDQRVTSRTCDPTALHDAVVVIEFSVPDGIEERLAVYAAAHKPAVIATTGWYDRMDAAQNIGATVIWSGNFAIGVHLFFSIVRHAANLLNRFPEYDPVVQELFHAQKADSPSGTSLMLGSLLLEELDGKSGLETARLDRRRSPDEIHISSARGGSHPGTHTLIFDSLADSIEITHRARSREGFATGALTAASWIIQGHKGFFSLEDMLAELTG